MRIVQETEDLFLKDVRIASYLTNGSYMDFL